MSRFLAIALLASTAWFSLSSAWAACLPGGYGPGDGDFVVVVPLPNVPPPGQRYLFRDGRRGSTTDADSPVACAHGAVRVRDEGRGIAEWPRLELEETDTTFDSHGARLAGRLIEPSGAGPRPLVVMVHGSERTPASASPYAYALAAQGLRVFAYDKRGTGESRGEFTMNFELLADDAAAALTHARGLAQGRVSRAGYFGGSQGGWVAPLASTRSAADFVAVGFGLVVSPIDEDREQMIDEARAAGLGDDVMAAIDRLSRATAKLLISHFKEGFEELDEVRRELADASWAESISGEHSGRMLRMRDADLRRVGRALFDTMELIWDYNAVAALARVEVPLLWVLAGEDREAPIERTREALTALVSAGQPIDLYLFPDTDHGMFEYAVLPDGTRRYTRITEGYLRLLADWMKEEVATDYGRGMRLANGAAGRLAPDRRTRSE